MTIPRIKTHKPQLSADDRVIIDFFKRSPEERHQIIEWRAGNNIVSRRKIAVDGYPWLELATHKGWMPVLELFRRVSPDWAEIRAAELSRAFADCVAKNKLLRERHQSQFDEYLHAILSLRSGSDEATTVMTFFGREYGPVPIVDLRKYNHTKQHACMICHRLYRRADTTSSPDAMYYDIIADCQCPATHVHEFEWDDVCLA